MTRSVSRSGFSRTLCTQIKRRALSSPFRRARHWWAYLVWPCSGFPIPPPQLIKPAIILDYAKRFDTKVFVETGTYFGDTVAVLRSHFDQLTTIEIDPYLFRRARQRFHQSPQLTVCNGDSAQLLPAIVKNLPCKAIFWLDAHYSSGITGRSLLNSPLLEELRVILECSSHDHVVLVDDARCVNGKEGYPTLQQLNRIVSESRPEYVVNVSLDVVGIHPRER